MFENFIWNWILPLLYYGDYLLEIWKIYNTLENNQFLFPRKNIFLTENEIVKENKILKDCF